MSSTKTANAQNIFAGHTAVNSSGAHLERCRRSETGDWCEVQGRWSGNADRNGGLVPGAKTVCHFPSHTTNPKWGSTPRPVSRPLWTANQLRTAATQKFDRPLRVCVSAQEPVESS